VSGRGRILVTGGSKGIGAAVSARLAADGWRVIVAARERGAIDATVSALPGDGHEALVLDVGDASAWDAAAATLDGDLAGVVCVAGTIGPIGPAEVVEPNAFMKTLQVNVLGSWLAARATRAALEASQGAFVAFSGGGATGPLPRFDAYAASKAAVVRLTENLAADGLRANAVAPGFVVTDLQDDVLAAGREQVGDAYFAKVEQAVAQGGGESPALAADLVAFLVSDAARGISGRLLSARWDPWGEPDFQERLRTEPDLATLRRIDDQFFTTTTPVSTP
jgi:NAD(P)-dependent dehydrogenase (short-subunit alcohol dehydrogenase family)